MVSPNAFDFPTLERPSPQFYAPLTRTIQPVAIIDFECPAGSDFHHAYRMPPVLELSLMIAVGAGLLGAGAWARRRFADKRAVV